MTALALLAADLGVNARTLRRAVRQGTVRATRPTPRTLDLPLDERQYLRRAWSLLAALRTALRTEPNVRVAVLFGSAATGATTPAGDVDLLVDLRDPDLGRLADLGSKLAVPIGRPVDLVRLRDAEADPAFLLALVTQGRVLVDREGAWQHLRAAEPDLRRRARRQEAGRAQVALAGIDRLLGA